MASGDLALVDALRRRDEAAFEELTTRYHGAMVRLARGFVGDDAAAEDVAQEAWLAILQGIDGFAGRGSLKGWIFAIVVNRAKTRGTRDARTAPFSALVEQEVCGSEPAVDPARFQTASGTYPGHWAQPPQPWADSPEGRLLSVERLMALRAAIDELPPAQRSVVLLRDVVGHESDFICNELGISETNMRVLLHRGRSKLRARLERLPEPI